MSINERILTFTAYLFGIPALYIVLTRPKSGGPARLAAERALVVWGLFFLIFFALRFLIDLASRSLFSPWLDNIEIAAAFIMGGYALYRAVKSLSDL